MRANLSGGQGRTNRDPIRLSPVVASLAVANVVVGILLATVFTHPAVQEVLQFDASLAFQHPWTFITYLFVHPGILALGLNLILLMGFGLNLERRMGGPSFLAYYLACGIGAAVFALGLTSFTNVPPLRGANGAVLGTALACWFAWPDARLKLDPFPIRPRVGTLVLALASFEIVLALLTSEGVAHLAFLGGLGTGYGVFRVQMLRARKAHPPSPPMPARALMTPVSVRQGGPPAPVRPPSPAAPPPERHPGDELDRVLDKISALGMQSLTPEERRFLNRISERKRKEPG